MTRHTSQSLQWDYYDALLQDRFVPPDANGDGSDNALTSRRVGNVNVFVVDPTKEGFHEDDDAREYLALCHLVGLLAFTMEFSSPEIAAEENMKRNRFFLSRGPGPYKELAAILLAAHHFNTGNGTVVPEVEGVNRRCDVRLTTEFQDTEFSVSSGLRRLTELVTRDDEDYKHEDDALKYTEKINSIPPPPPCAVIGTHRSQVTIPTATLSSVYDTVQMSFAASSTKLNDARNTPGYTFARVIPSDDTTAMAAVHILADIMKAQRVAVIYVDDDFGSAFASAFGNLALDYTLKGWRSTTGDEREEEDAFLQTQSFPLPVRPTSDDIHSVIFRVNATEYRYIFSIVFNDVYEGLMQKAHEFGIAGHPYFWLFVDTTGMSSMIEKASYPRGSVLDVATGGIGLLSTSAACHGCYRRDEFVRSWKSLGADDVRYFNSKVPKTDDRKGDIDDGTNVRYYQAADDFFQVHEPGSDAAFAYDTVILMGLAACNASALASSGVGTYEDIDDEYYFTGSKHIKAIERIQFSGASGRIELDPRSNSRVQQESFFVLENVQRRMPGNNSDNDKSYVTYDVKNSILLNPLDEVGWDEVHLEPFLYADGTEEAPLDLPLHEENFNYIGEWKIFGLVLNAVVMLLSVAFAVWTFVKRNARVVKASQPFFLVMICLGTLIMGSSIIPLSIDDESFSVQTASRACMAVPWLICLGFVTSFSALFSKLWRINKIFNNPSRFKRVKVTERDVLGPFVCLLLANIIILVCWTVFAPLSFNRIEDGEGTDRFNRVIRSVGLCQCKDPLPYMILLGAINFGVVVLANFQAYRARNVKTEYSESRYIGIVMASLLQAMLIGVPVIFLVHEYSSVASYFVKTLLVFITCMAILLLIFIPKVKFARKYEMHRRRVNEERAKENEKKTPATCTTCAEEGRNGNDDSASANTNRISAGMVGKGLRYFGHTATAQPGRNDYADDDDDESAAAGLKIVIQDSLVPETDNLVHKQPHRKP